ncbi:polysaccharide deacetylase family protein [Paenibacillus endoradicis]|uniref:polysaccharide deacetylase family protein n=1 Tax=Paenibacillus endoradicis TaxID=2972487 RepID=UPI0021593441|nr:polysaccharide deacetylase family protein [Paenibacillus endoradicis]MCR8656981.1 polysaccharide deacetylase family protein [Paenibacillus endoradicis]
MVNKPEKLTSFVKWKNRRKVVRTVLQFFVVIFVGYLIVNSLMTLKTYDESDRSTWTNHDNFIAVSYFGVSRSTTSDLVSKRELDAQINALYDHGYVTISQQDVIDFYTKGSPLPEKALYLSFEDGRNDSALFTTKILENYNYKATMLTYANKMGNDQGKFLQPKELLSMTKKGFWELGTNGYRLTYINILDKDENYFEQQTQEQFLNKNEAQYYTHYLMDFIRDKNNIPVETRVVMEERIQLDYDLVEKIYKDKLGFVPTTYMIMHADTLYNGMDGLVENVNDTNIRELFKLHYNREGKLLNTSSMDRYDLTRVQPAPYWRTNHLIMKLGLDTNDNVTFVTGDEDQAKKWTIVDGVAEFAPEEIALTTRPAQKATMKINDVKVSNQYSLDLVIGGHSSGIQYIQLGQSSDGQLKLQLRVQDENVYVEQVAADGEVERLLGVRGKDVGLADIPISLQIQNQTISMSINNNLVMEHEEIDESIDQWYVQLEAESLQEENRWEDEGDHIYDGVFKRITLANIDDEGKVIEKLYSNHLKGLAKVTFTTKRIFNNMIDWAIETF